MMTEPTVKESKKVESNFLDLSMAIKRPSNIMFNDNFLTQTNILANAKTLCIIDFPVLSISGKIVFKIAQLKKTSQLVIGVMPKKVYESMNEVWSLNKLD